MHIRKGIFGAAGAICLSCPATASDLTVGDYPNGPSYERHTYTHEYRTEPRVVVAEPAPVATETIVVRRPVVVTAPRVVVEEFRL